MVAELVPIERGRNAIQGIQERLASAKTSEYNRPPKSGTRPEGGDLGRAGEWIRSIAEDRSQEAFEQLYRTYQKRLFSYIYRLLGNREDAEEALDDAMLAVWHKAGSFEGRSRPLVWLFGIARFKALNTRRRQSWTENGDEDMERFVSLAAGVEKTLIQRDLATKALRRLPPKHREVVELTFFHGFSYKEIANIVDCPENTVKTRMHHARKNLRSICLELMHGRNGE